MPAQRLSIKCGAAGNGALVAADIVVWLYAGSEVV